MKTDILEQLARSTLLPHSVSVEVLAGTETSIGEIVLDLLIRSLDAEALVSGDADSTWNQKRLARQLLIVTFLSALAVARNEQ